MEPNTEYIVSYEVLRDDLASNSEYEVSVEVGGYDFGSCQGGGGDYDCNFVSCGSSGTTSIQSDENGDIYVKTSFTGNSYDCDCNRADVSVDCVKERYVIIHNHIYYAHLRNAQNTEQETTTTLLGFRRRQHYVSLCKKSIRSCPRSEL